jgi:hypothetical protein
MPKAAKQNQTWTFQRVNELVCSIDFAIRTNAEPVRMLCLSDLHWDNPKCDRVALKKVLDQALAYNAPILLVGDTFCCMQGKYDKRSSKEDIRPEHRTHRYFDSLVFTAAEWFRPYAKNLAILGYGNHENSVLERHETDLLYSLAQELRRLGGITEATGYHGFLLSKIIWADKKTPVEVGYYHHGFGGGGPVTKGTIDFNRYANQVRADYYLAGHVHRMNTDISRVIKVCTKTGSVRASDIDYVRMSTFKEEGLSPNGWHTERGMGPRPIGGWWCEWHVSMTRNKEPDRITDREGTAAKRTYTRRRFVRAI